MWILHPKQNVLKSSVFRLTYRKEIQSLWSPGRKLMERMKYMKMHTACLLKKLASSSQLNIFLLKYVCEAMLICTMLNDKKPKNVWTHFYQQMCEFYKASYHVGKKNVSREICAQMESNNDRQNIMSYACTCSHFIIHDKSVRKS